MSRQPVRGGPANKASVGSRSFKRTSKALQERSARREFALRRALAARRGSSLGLKALIKRVPSAAWMCALIALLNGVAWSIITPPFQGRDEPSHFAYVQQLAETGTLLGSSKENTKSTRPRRP
jgi:hypothetical protein